MTPQCHSFVGGREVILANEDGGGRVVIPQTVNEVEDTSECISVNHLV